MDIEFLRKNYKSKILEIAEICHVENIRIFGSRVRGDERSDSDIDFLVHIKPDAGIEYCGMQWRLEELLNMKVDVVPDQNLHPRIKDRILNEAVVL